MLQKIFPEDFPAILSESLVDAGWSTATHIKDGYGVVQGSLSRETNIAEVGILLVPTFTRSEPLHFYLLHYMKNEISRKKSCYD